MVASYIHTRCRFWFTESGLRRYADDLTAFAKRIRKENWSLLYAVFEASDEDLAHRVYHDRWQAAWPIEYKTAHAAFREVGHIRADAHKCCVYPRKLPYSQPHERSSYANSLY